MNVINEILTPPTFKFLHLISYLVYFMLLFHLPYMGMVLVSSILSTAYGKGKPQLSKDFINLAVGKTGIWIIFGLLPAASLAVLYRMLLFNASIPIHLYLLRIFGIMVVGFILLTIYRRTSHITAGAAGALLILVYCFFLVNLMSLLIYPEKWPFLKLPIPYPLFSITPLIHFAGFLFLSLIMTGAAVLFFYYKWPEKRLPEDSPHYQLMKYHGFGFLLAGSLLMPLMIFWDLYTLPGYSLSVPVFVLTGLIIVTLFLLSYTAAAMIRNHKDILPRYTVVSLLLALLLFGLVIGKDRTLQANASLETITVLAGDARKAWDEAVGKREELYAKTAGIDAKRGEEIYSAQCTACHAFDQKKLGPPLNDVLPKYKGKEDELIAFLKNPQKIDPQYPAMPNPGLTTIKIKSVVKFLMGKMGVNPPEEKE